LKDQNEGAEATINKIEEALIFKCTGAWTCGVATGSSKGELRSASPINCPPLVKKEIFRGRDAASMFVEKQERQRQDLSDFPFCTPHTNPPFFMCLSFGNMGVHWTSLLLLLQS